MVATLPGGQPTLFTVEQANALLPTIRKYLRDVRRCLAALPELGKSNPGHEEGPVPRQIFLAAATLQSSWRAILESGVQIKDLQSGLLDFPASHNGETILLCIKDGEENIQFWHDLHKGFSGRRPVSELDSAVLGEEN